MKNLILSAALLLGLLGQAATANDLFYDRCVDTHANSSRHSTMLEGAQIIFVTNRGGVMGLTCEDLRGMQDFAQTVELALYPATLAIALSPAKGQLLTALAELGLTMANPAVLGVTVLGATGGVVIYLVMKKTMQDCDRMDKEELRQAIIQELENKYGVNASGSRLRIMH